MTFGGSNPYKTVCRGAILAKTSRPPKCIFCQDMVGLVLNFLVNYQGGLQTLNIIYYVEGSWSSAGVLRGADTSVIA